MTYDVAIVGLGAMGSAAAYALANKGVRVIGFDRFRPPHAAGSSHGRSRIIREAYFERPEYVGLVQRAYERWLDLEQRSGESLLTICGGLTIGPEGAATPEGARLSARTHGLPHELLTARDLQRRFPAFRLPDHMIGIWEPRGGVLFPEGCIDAHLRLAADLGATFVFEEPVLDWRPDRTDIRLRTSKRDCHAGHLILSAGAWVTELLRELHLPLTVERTVMHWFQPHAPVDAFAPERFPIFLIEHAPERIFYGFPNLGEGVKVARHHQGHTTTADAVDRHVTDGEVDDMRTLLRRFLPGANGSRIASTVCMYTNTPDLDFVLDRHPAYPHVIVASPCSGHGFKFASVIGEILADLVTEGRTTFDLSLFRLARLIR